MTRKIEFKKKYLSGLVRGPAALIAATLFLTSCMSDTEDPAAENPGQETPKDRFSFLRQDDVPQEQMKPETLDEEQVTAEPAKGTEKMDEKIKSVPRTAQQPKLDATKQPQHFYDDDVALNGDDEIEVNLVFNSAPLLDVLSSFADVLGFSFLADSDLKGVVTLNIAQKMTRSELWNTFDKMLNLAGANVTVDGPLLRIVSLAKLANQPNARLAKDGTGELFYYPLKNSTAKDVINQIKPFLTKDSSCVELTRPNAILVADDISNMPKIKELLDVIDMSGKSAWKRKVVRCRNILPSKLVTELQNVLPVLGFNVLTTTDKTEVPGSIQMTGLDRLQLLLVSAATDEAISEIEQWVDMLDSSDSLDQERVFVYKVRCGKASDLLQALSVIYDVQGSSLTIDTSTGNSRVDSVNSSTTNTNRNRTTTTGSNAQNAMNNTQNTQTDRNSSVFDNTVRVFSDGVLNRLIVRTTPRTYASIKALLNRLDVVPAQVLLQVLVAEVTLTESTNFGLEFSAEGSGSADSLLGTNYSNLTPPFDNVKENGFSYLLTDPNNPETRFGYLKALAGNNAVKVISSPQILVSSHTEASISVGSDIPVITGGITNSSSETNVTQTYDYKETGVILKVTPQITSTDMIALDLTQTISRAKGTAYSSTISSPEITKREVVTSMTIANGKTMIIGGLIEETVEDNLSTIPGIKQIPILNRLLGSTEASVKRSEILVMITGYIVNERSKVEDMIKRYNEAINTLNEFHEKLGTKENAGKNDSGIITKKGFWMNGAGKF